MAKQQVKNQIVKIYLTAEEKKKLNKRITKSGLSTSTYLRLILKERGDI